MRRNGQNYHTFWKVSQPSKWLCRIMLCHWPTNCKLIVFSIAILPLVYGYSNLTFWSIPLYMYYVLILLYDTLYEIRKVWFNKLNKVTVSDLCIRKVHLIFQQWTTWSEDLRVRVVFSFYGRQSWIKFHEFFLVVTLINSRNTGSSLSQNGRMRQKFKLCCSNIRYVLQNWLKCLLF
jgi:hypothetical protein